MKKIVLFLLSVICLAVVSGCGNSSGIDGTWVLKMPESKVVVKKMVFEKQNDFSYKGTFYYEDGTTHTSTFAYYKDYNALEEDASDARARGKEQGTKGTQWAFKFNDKYTEAHIDSSGKPDHIYVKQ